LNFLTGGPVSIAKDVLHDSIFRFLRETIACQDWLAILDELNIGAFMVGRHRRIESLNLSAQAMIGVRGNDAVGKDCREVFLGVPCLVSCPFKGPQDSKQSGADPAAAGRRR